MRLLRNHPALLFLGAMGLGLGLGSLGEHAQELAVLGVLIQGAQSAVDPIIMILLTLLFIEVRLPGGRELLGSKRAAVAALLLNFIVLPPVALGLTALMFPDDPLLRLGVLIYLLFPCTDWFLGFIRVAGGNIALGAALIPVTLVLQLMLYPVWVSAVTDRRLPVVLEALVPAMLVGVLIPAGLAVVVRIGLRTAAGASAVEALQRRAAAGITGVIAVLILSLFLSGAGEAVVTVGAFVQIAFAVGAFFLVSAAVAGLVGRWARLDHGDLVLVMFTTSARNAPLMLAVTGLALGEQAVISAAIVLGMLLEFPHLALLSWWLRRRQEAVLCQAGDESPRVCSEANNYVESSVRRSIPSTCPAQTTSKELNP